MRICVYALCVLGCDFFQRNAYACTHWISFDVLVFLPFQMVFLRVVVLSCDFFGTHNTTSQRSSREFFSLLLFLPAKKEPKILLDAR